MKKKLEKENRRIAIEEIKGIISDSEHKQYKIEEKIIKKQKYLDR